jgi:hypothetical protein
LEFDSIVVLNHGADNGILDLVVMKVHADFVADIEFGLWFFGWHASVTGSGGTLSAVGSHRKVPPRGLALRGARSTYNQSSISAYNGTSVLCCEENLS